MPHCQHALNQNAPVTHIKILHFDWNVCSYKPENYLAYFHTSKPGSHFLLFSVCIFIKFRLTLELSHDKPTETGNLEIIVE
jgi:hypothetical protein